MLHITICITLLTLIAAMHLLAKTQKEGLGSFFKWTSYLIITIAALVLICQICCSCGRMCGSKEMKCEVRIEKGCSDMKMGESCDDDKECKDKKGCEEDDDDDVKDSTKVEAAKPE